MSLRTIILTAVCGVVLSLCGGCAVIGWTVSLFVPAEKVPAEYEPPKGKAYLVFVDDVAAPVEYEGVKRELTEQLNVGLEQQKIASRTIDYGDVVKLVAATPRFQQLSVSEVGRKLGADIVVYVRIKRFELAEYAHSSTWNGLMEVSLRVVDVKQQRRLWPVDRPAGFPVEPVQMPQVDLDTRDQVARMSKMLAELTAERVIRLFVKHPKPSVAEDAGRHDDW